MSIEYCDFTVKVIFIGDTNTGKTSTLQKLLCPNQAIVTADRVATIGVEFGAIIKKIADKKIKFQVWDTAGQEKYRSITNSFYKNTTIAVLFCDLTQYTSYRSLETWLQDIRKYAPETVTILLVGNKSDLYTKRQIDRDTILYFANSNNLSYIEVSVFTGEGIDNILISPMEDVLKKHNAGQQISGLRIQESIEVKTGSKLCKNCIIS